MFPVPDGLDFVGITSPQNPGGTPNIETANVLSPIKARSLMGDLDFIPYIRCKDQNRDALVSSLRGFGAMGVETVLVITGDKPVKGKGGFELESIGLLQMIKKMNSEQYLKARSETLDHIHQFFAGAVVSPFCSPILQRKKLLLLSATGVIIYQKNLDKPGVLAGCRPGETAEKPLMQR